MKDNPLINKLANNKKILLIIPHLFYINTLLSRYLINKEIILFENIIIVIALFFTTTIFLHQILKKIIKNNQIIFLILFLISTLYLCPFDIKLIIQILVYSILLFIMIRKKEQEQLDIYISIIIFIIFAYFSMFLPQNLYKIINQTIRTKTYDESINIKIDKELETPNIYWIHSDAMMNLNDIKKYFKYDNQTFLNYLKKEGYYINENASLIADHKTQKALAAMFNPNYYDNFLKEYLYELEDIHLKKETKTTFEVSTKEMSNYRFDSELLKSLKKKNYKTVAITKLNNYSSIKADIIYDYYNHTTNHWHFPKKKELRKLSTKSVDNINRINRINQLKEVLTFSIFSGYTNNLIPYEHEIIDYNNMELDEYKTINNTKYWQSVAILKSLKETQEITSNKFVFIDYDLNHPELSFNIQGEPLSKNNYMNLKVYKENYIYSCNILMDILSYIKKNDQNAIIILQSDHGLHTFDNEYLQENLEISNSEVQDIRNSVMSAIYIPKKYQNGDEIYLNNPLNISRYIVNNYIGKNYEYIEKK